MREEKPLKIITSIHIAADDTSNTGILPKTLIAPDGVARVRFNGGAITAVLMYAYTDEAATSPAITTGDALSAYQEYYEIDMDALGWQSLYFVTSNNSGVTLTFYEPKQP